jgi:hypothetical protein
MNKGLSGPGINHRKTEKRYLFLRTHFFWTFSRSAREHRLLITFGLHQRYYWIFLLALLSGRPFAFGCQPSCSSSMSSFQLNMSALTLGARERIARLDAAGGAVRALLSPAPSGAAASGAAALTSSPSVASGTPRMSVELLLASGSGRTGESDVVLLGGSTGGLSVFVLLPDQADKMCLGAVAGGIKFCTLDAGMCFFSTHSKKVEVTPRAIYISTGRQSAFSHHFAPIDLLTQDEIDRLLEECHSKEECIRLLLGLTKDASSLGTLKAGAVMGTMSVLDAVTHGRKRKVRYEDEADLGGGPNSSSSQGWP